MSIYYTLQCGRCQKTGGFFSRQAWGVGNADLIETFKFLAWHTFYCDAGAFEDGATYFSTPPATFMVLSENDDDYFDNEDAELLDNALGMFPHTDDWKFMADHADVPAKELDALWTEQQKTRRSQQ